MRAITVVLICALVFSPVCLGEETAVRVFPATRKGDFSRKLAIKIREHKACAGLKVTANKEEANYTAMHGLTTSGWVVYRRNGDVVATGSTMLFSTFVREVCEAIKKDWAEPK